MARTQSEKYPEIRDGILARSAKLFARKGFATTTIADLCKACKVSRGALYHYFQSKEDILYSLLKEHLLFLRDQLADAFATSEDPVERLRTVVRAFVGINARSRDRQIVLLNDMNQLIPNQQKELTTLQRNMLDLLEAAIAAVPDAPGVTAENRRVHTMMLIGIINYTYTWYDAKGAVGPDEYAALALDTFLNGIRARA